MVEFLVHFSWAHLPSDIHIAGLQLPDQPEPEILPPDRLPKNWRNHPAPDKLARLGTEWARSNRGLLLRVPSAVVDQEYNILINPSHPDVSPIKILKAEEMKFDRRLIRQA
jgi:RES domain-containing protein